MQHFCFISNELGALADPLTYARYAQCECIASKFQFISDNFILFNRTNGFHLAERYRCCRLQCQWR